MAEAWAKRAGPGRLAWRIVQVAVGLVAFGILFSQVDLGKLLESSRNAKMGWLLLALPISFIIHVWSWISHVYLLKVMGRPQPGVWFYRVFLLTQGISMAAPGKLGDFSVVWFLKKRGVPYSEGLALAFYYKVIALVLNGWLGLIGLAAWLGDPRGMVAAVMVPAVCLLLWMGVHGRMPERFFQWLVARRHGAHVAPFLKAWGLLTSARPVAVSILLALLKTWIMASVFTVILSAYGEPVSPALIVTLQAVVRLVAMVPISPSGLGVRELSGTLLLVEWAGVPPVVAVNVMLISLLFQWGIGLCCYFGNIKLFQDFPREGAEGE